MSIDVSRQPRRIQLSRKKGFKLADVSRRLNGLTAINVARPTRWGNPFRSVNLFVTYAVNRAVDNPEWLKPLRGKNLACWCRPGDKCHADVLLQLCQE